MFFRRHDRSYLAVAGAIILAGAAIFAFGVVAWLVNTAQGATSIAFPSMKVIGGLVIMSLGYIQMELGLLREKK